MVDDVFERHLYPTARFAIYKGNQDGFRVTPATSRFHDFRAVPLMETDEGPMRGFSVVEASIVEINGDPVPVLSAPLCPPADDYPYAPTFDYNDGPQALAEDALRKWWEKLGAT